MTAALAEDGTAAHPAGTPVPHAATDTGSIPTSPRRPHLMPVPDSEPPLAVIRHDEFLRSTVPVPIRAGRGLDRAAVHPARPAHPMPDRHPGYAIHGVPESPAMAHRRWAPQRDDGVCSAAVAAGTPGRSDAAWLTSRVGLRGPAREVVPTVPPRLHSAVGIALAPESTRGPADPSAPRRPSKRTLPTAALTTRMPTTETPAARPPATTAPARRPLTTMPGRPASFEVATRLVQVTIEALAGQRPLSHLRRHFTSGVYCGIQNFPRLDGRRGIRIASVWVCEPRPDTAEVAAAIRCGSRTRALAMQLRAVDGHWMVTVLQMG